MTKYELIDQLIDKSDGIIKTSDAVAAGVSKTFFYNYAKDRGLKQASHGVYISSDAWTDAMYLLHVRCPQAVFSHDTALFLHDLTDREPLRYTVTVRSGYNPWRLTADNIKVYTVKPALHELGLSKGETAFGRTVPIYDMERTVCDIIRSRNDIEVQTFQDALKQYVRRGDKNLRRLTQYAQAFRVEKILRQYLEVLL